VEEASSILLKIRSKEFEARSFLKRTAAFCRLFDSQCGGTFSGMTTSFLKSLGVWSLFTCVPVLVLVLSSGRVNGDQLFVIFLLFLLPLAGTIVLYRLVGEQKSIWRNVLYGLALGFAIPVLGGFLLWIITPGFESPAILVGALMMAIPSSIGGALAGWIQGSSDIADRTMEVR